MDSEQPSKYIVNPASGRMVLRNSQTGRRVLKLAQCEPPRPQPPPPPPPPPPIDESPKAILAKAGVDVVAKNKKRLAKCETDEDMDALLKKLLYAKLCGTKTKSKKAKKPKRPPVSESDYSDSDSDSD